MWLRAVPRFVQQRVQRFWAQARRRPVLSMLALLAAVLHIGVSEFWPGGWAGAGRSLTATVGGGLTAARAVGADTVSRLWYCRFDYRLRCIDPAPVPQMVGWDRLVPVAGMPGCYRGPSDPPQGLGRQEFATPSEAFPMMRSRLRPEGYFNIPWPDADTPSEAAKAAASRLDAPDFSAVRSSPLLLPPGGLRTRPDSLLSRPLNTARPPGGILGNQPPQQPGASVLQQMQLYRREPPPPPPSPPPPRYACFPEAGAPWAILGTEWHHLSPVAPLCKAGPIGMVFCLGYWGFESMLGLPQTLGIALWNVLFSHPSAFLVLFAIIGSYVAICRSALRGDNSDMHVFVWVAMPGLLVGGLGVWFYAVFGFFDLLWEWWPSELVGAAWVTGVGVVGGVAKYAAYLATAGGAVTRANAVVDGAGRWSSRLGRLVRRGSPPQPPSG